MFDFKSIMSLGVSDPTKQLAVPSTATVLPNRQGNQAFVKENENKYMCKRNLNL